MTQSDIERDRLIEKAARAFDAYGADMARWPDETRTECSAVIDAPELAAARAAARIVDAGLAAAPAPAMRDGLKDDILAGFDLPRRKTGGFLSAVTDLFGGMRIIPAGALAGLSALGLALGVVTAPSASLPPEQEAYAYVAAIDYDATEEEGAWWVVE